MKQSKPRRLSALFLTFLLMLVMAPAALADTDETTPRITQQPDQLVLQLGVRWAGVEFELRTDAGRFPVPVVVNESGILTMDLGGSTTYTLTCLDSSVPVPTPEPEQLGGEDAPATQLENTEAPESSVNRLLVVFVVLLLVVIVVLAVLIFMKQRQQDVYDDWEEEEEVL